MNPNLLRYTNWIKFISILFFCIPNTHAGRQKKPTKKTDKSSKPKIINKMAIKFITIKTFSTKETLLIHILGQHYNGLVKHVCKLCFVDESNKPKFLFRNRYYLCNHINKEHPNNKGKRHYLYCSDCSHIIKKPNKNIEMIKHLQTKHSLPNTPNIQQGDKSKPIKHYICWVCNPHPEFEN